MAELKEARVPDIGGYDDVPVIEVLAAVGDAVTQDQGLITLESDKATMEVPAPFAGVIREFKVKVGDHLSAGDLVAIIEIEGDVTAAPSSALAGEGGGGGVPDAANSQVQAMAPKAAPSPQPSPASGRGSETGPADGGRSGAVETGTQVEPVLVPAQADNIAQASIARTEAMSPTPTKAADAQAAPMGAGGPPVRFEADALLPDKVPYASPAVRLFARELGVDLMRVSGSARGGRISKEDIQGFVKSALHGGAGVVASDSGGQGFVGLVLLPWPKVDFAKFGEIETKPLARIKKIAGANLARNWAMIPHVTQHDDADITELEALRVALNKENEKAVAKGNAAKLTMLAFLIKASVSALQKYPDFNASLDASGENLVLKKYFHIGFAADTPNGLVVPVVRDCDQKGVFEIAQETSELAGKAREGKLGPAQMSGGCFTISSLGGIGGTGFTPIVNAPEVAILGVSKSAMKPVWDGKQFAPRLLLPLSLSYDHRVIDGASAARFTAYLAQLLGDMRRALL